MNLLKELRKKYKLLQQKKKSQKKIKKFSFNNDISVFNDDLSRISISIQGCGNVIKIGKLAPGNGKLIIKVAGNNNVIEIKNGCKINNTLRIIVGQIHFNFGPIQNVKCCIGELCGFESCDVITFNSNAIINVGDKCMVSYNVNIYHTDAHPILDVKTNKIINKVKSLTIGNHVWIGANSTILKNTSIANDCIVGWGSIVSGNFSEPYCAIAGNPACVVKKGITWDSNGSKGYVQNED